MRSMFFALPVLLMVGCTDGDKDDTDSGDTDTDTDTGTDTETDPDADNDGYPASEDCDDSNADINPGATEVCDTLDNDCDDLIDDDDDTLDTSTASVYYADLDGDGYGTDKTTLLACEQPSSYTADGGDCEDADKAISPGVPEDCADGIDNDCTTVFDCEDTGCTGDTACVATVDAIDPSIGLTVVKDPIFATLTGSGFAHGNAGTTTVTVGGFSVSGLTVVDDSTITFDIPPSKTEGVVDVVFTNDNGSSTLKDGFQFLACPLFAAKGSGGTIGDLYCIDPIGGTYSSLMTLTNSYTGLAFAPDGTLYGVESTGGGSSRLLVIDFAKGTETAIDFLYDTTTTSTIHGSIPDITFVGSRLIGWSEHYINSSYDVPVEIDTKTAQVTQLTTSSIGSYNTGLAADSKGTIYMATGLSSSLYTIDAKTGTSAGSITLDGSCSNCRAELAFFDGTLYSLDCGYSGTGACDLVEVDPSTGATTNVMTGLPTGLDALASPVY